MGFFNLFKKQKSFKPSPHLYVRMDDGLSEMLVGPFLNLGAALAHIRWCESIGEYHSAVETMEEGSNRYFELLRDRIEVITPAEDRVEGMKILKQKAPKVKMWPVSRSAPAKGYDS